MKTITTLFWTLTIAACLGFAPASYADAGTNNATQAVLQQPFFRERLIWLGTVPPAEKESAKLLQILRKQSGTAWMTDVEKFLNDNPNSPWAASLHQVYADYCHDAGRTTKALSHWEAAWELVKDDASSAGRRMGGQILGAWTQQLSSLGRREKLKELIPQGDHWQFLSRADREKFQSAKHNYYIMGKFPEMSFRCGTLALKAVGQELQPTNQNLQSLVDMASPANGFDMAGLSKLAKQCGLDLVAVRRVQGQDLIVPSVIHWRQNHYAAILAGSGERYLVNDPTFGKPKWMSAEAINEEASGAFLIPASAQTANWQSIAPAELASIHGKGLPNNINDWKDKGCTTGVGGQKNCPCPGMPVWWVSEPYINLWIADEPLSYLTSTGEPFTFRLSFSQRGSPDPTYVPGAYTTNGLPYNPWTHSWNSYIQLQSTNDGSDFPTLGNSEAFLILPGGGAAQFAAGQQYDPETKLFLEQVDPNASLKSQWGGIDGALQYAGGPSQDSGDTGLRVIHSDGSQDIYGYGLSANFSVNGGIPATATYMLSRRIDSHGRTTSFAYNTFGGSATFLQYVVDYDGRTNTLNYTQIFNNSTGVNGWVITSVSNPYGLTASFQYDAYLNLSNITDAAGMSSSILYDTNLNPIQLTTPYGTNIFALYENTAVESTNDAEGNMGGDELVDRAAIVTDTTGGTHLFLYQYDCHLFMPTNYVANTVPTNTPLGTLDTGTGGTNFLTEVCYRNSFSWDARQCASLSLNNLAGTNLVNLSSNDFIRGAMKHWLEDTNYLSLTGYLSVQRDASPDGATEGLKTFYDYQGKIYPQRAGTNALPSVIAWCLPGGETHYEYVQYDYFGNITNRITTYTTPGGAWGTRTNQYVYANNTYTNIIYGDNYDGTNWGLYLPISTNTYTVPNLLTKVVEANGSNVWTFGGFDSVVFFTNYDVLNVRQSNRIVLSGLRVQPDFTTNGLGQVTKRTYTNFDLVTSVQWPEGLIRTNVYNTNGFLVQTVDQQIHRTNSFAYGTNGLITKFTNELGLSLVFSWDNLLRLTGVAYPDSTTVSNVYSRLDVSATKDWLGNWTYFGYDGLRHLTSVTNANTNVTSYGWCDCGALTSVTDPLTNTYTLYFDFQSRLTNILFPDTATLNYQYDLAGRKINVFDGLSNSFQLSYNNQGLVTSLTNTYGTMAQFVFDILDRPTKITDANGVTVTNTYDMLDRVINRVWTADGLGETFTYTTNGLIAYTNRNQKGTQFVRDVAGRATAVTNADQQPTQFFYDPAGHLTNLLDASSRATTWNYNQYGWVTNKVDATNRVAFLYAYDANGRVTNRWMLGSGNTQYKYDPLGNLTNIVYSNALTAAISYFYDADNRMTNMVDGVGTNNFTYTQTGEPFTESNPFSSTSGTLALYYNQGHRSGLSLSQPSGTPWAQNYYYDQEWRLTNLATTAGSFTYIYPNSPSTLIQSVALPNYAGITYQYDSLARLTNTSLANYWGHVLDGAGYAYDALGQRTNISRYLGLTTNNIAVGYDNIGQLISWAAKETSGAARMNEQLGYGYDPAGNLHFRTNSALAQTFGVDTLNQLSAVTRTGTLTETGATPATATNLTVNGVNAQTYGDFTFARTNLSLANGTNVFTNIAQNVYGVTVTNMVTLNLPVTNSFQYDANGNLTNDGTRTFIYDAENQLTNVNVPRAWKTEYAYDGFRRKRITRDYVWTAIQLHPPQLGWLKTNETHYLYDGMLVIQECDTNNNPLVTYTRGLDLSGTRQGAGGIGGLLARTDTNGTAFYHCDGSGNITALIDYNQNIVARYEYDGFGRLIGKWGTLADANAYRFSSKEFQRSSGLYYHGYRFYEPNFQRWLNQDPIGILGGVNEHRFVGNNSLTFVDPLGLEGALVGAVYSYGTSAAQAGPNAEMAQLTAEGNALLAEGGGGAAGTSGAVGLGAAYGLGVGILLDHYLHFDQDAETYPYGVNGPPMTATSPFPVGWTGTDGERRDTDGNTLDANGNIVRDKNGNQVKCNDKSPRKKSKIDRSAFAADRRAFWKAEAANNPQGYSESDLERMREGKPPVGPDGYPMELHHENQEPDGPLTPMSRTDHRLGENYKLNHP